MAGEAQAAAIAMQAISSGYKMHRGNKMRKKGEALEKSLTRPTATTPEEINQNLAHAYALSKEGIRAAQENKYLDNIATNQASTINAFQSRKGGMVGAEVASRERRKAERDLLVLDAQQRYENELNLMKHRGIKADYERENFWYNQAGSYAEGMNRALALQGAGEQNISTGLDELSGSVAGYSAGRSNGSIPFN